MNTETHTIDGHTFIPQLLNYDGICIDAGCRGGNFSVRLRDDFNQDVIALDIEDFSKEKWTQLSNITFKHAALSPRSGETEAYYFGNGTANFLKGLNDVPGNTTERPCETKLVKCITLQEIYKEFGTSIELLKMDIESSEYEILVSMEPIPKQISVEMHQHTTPDLHDQYIDAIMEHLCKSYHCNLYIREWPRYKYMDCLFIRKDLI
jgi:FkbM family methyltransferase